MSPVRDWSQCKARKGKISKIAQISHPRNTVSCRDYFSISDPSSSGSTFALKYQKRKWIRLAKSVGRIMGTMTVKLTRKALGDLLLRSLLCSQRSLICLLRTVCFARALRCAHSFARLLTHPLRNSRERVFFSMK